MRGANLSQSCRSGERGSISTGNYNSLANSRAIYEMVVSVFLLLFCWNI